MIRTYSQRLTPPFSGQVQIAESERARAITMDGAIWEIQFIYTLDGDDRIPGHPPKRKYVRAAYVKQSQLQEVLQQPDQGNPVDGRILELVAFLTTVTLPFTATDRYEYWLLDPSDDSPLALIFTCSDAVQMATFPQRMEWTALPAAVMPIAATTEEQQSGSAPVNYRLERLVAERAGRKPYARWFTRRPSEPDIFPPLLLREDWEKEEERVLCQRYIERQSSRLLMLHGLETEDRLRLEIAAKPHAFEVERFFPLYPEIADEGIISAIRVEARLRHTTDEEDGMHQRRDGVLYI